MIVDSLKKRFVSCGFFFNFASWMTRKYPRVFMYHRFSTIGKAVSGKVAESSFKLQVEVLAKGWRVLSLREFTEIVIKEGRPPDYSVVLTVDDGYNDFYLHAFPWLKKYSLPATFFPAVNFLDCRWLWWDRINYVFEKSVNKRIIFEFSGKTFDLDLSEQKSKEVSWLLLSNYCTGVDNDVKLALLSKLEEALDVKLPPCPPKEYSAVSWETLKELHNSGIEIGSHTLDHPIVSKINMEMLKDELNLSKKRLEEYLGTKVVSFCYPNGKPDDLNDTVCKQVKMSGYKGAVVSYNGPWVISDLYRIPRMGIGADMVDFHWKLCGMETLIQSIKGRFTFL